VSDADALWKLGVALRKGDPLPRDLVAAAKWLARAARSGTHPWARIVYGDTLLKGEGVAQDTDAARRLYESACAVNSFARVRLGQLYERGAPGLDPDPARARGEYARAAAAGDAWGMHYYARLLLEGIGGPEDPAEAARQLRLGASLEKPLDLSLVRLAKLLETHSELALDPGEARRHLERAAALGSEEARRLLETEQR
jgi:TPR repeat protein